MLTSCWGYCISPSWGCCIWTVQRSHLSFYMLTSYWGGCIWTMQVFWKVMQAVRQGNTLANHCNIWTLSNCVCLSVLAYPEMCRFVWTVIQALHHGWHFYKPSMHHRCCLSICWCCGVHNPIETLWKVAEDQQWKVSMTIVRARLFCWGSKAVLITTGIRDC